MLSGLFSRRITVCSPESFKTAHGGKEKKKRKQRSGVERTVTRTHGLWHTDPYREINP